MLLEAVTLGGIADIDEFLLEREKYAHLFGFHFHSDTGADIRGSVGAIVPSGEDLESQSDEFSRFSGSYMIPYTGVGHVSNNGNVDVLVIQSPPNVVTAEERDEYDSQADNVQSQQQLEELLLSLGFTSKLIHFEKIDDGYTLRSESEELLRTLTPMKAVLGDNDRRADLIEESGGIQ